ncbi:MAG: hydrogenase expression protein HypE [Acetobacteraceae bacterium]|nr:hydrogenase expression protein HypE [Acetobacteraceae bacterium]
MSGLAQNPASTIIRAGAAMDCQPWPRMLLRQEAWTVMAAALAREPGLALIALWADPTDIHALFVDEAAGAVLFASVPVQGGRYPALSPTRPGAAWYERMIADLWGHTAQGGTDGRAWLDHGRWPQVFPLATRPGPAGPAPEPPEFLPTDGQDLHQIPVGPIHAGIIEPGHFRFTAQGETIARLEIRLGYTHKGTLSLMRGKSPRVAARFAARLSGDSTVAHSLAFSHATEAALGVEIPMRAVMLRAVMAELERMANHLGDIGAICNDASFAFAFARFGFLREEILRASSFAFGHRLMMDCVIPGGIAADLAPGGAETIAQALASVEAELPALIRIYGNYASLVDRMATTGVIAPNLTAQFAAGGYVGRAAGRQVDARRFPSYPPYDAFPPTIPVLITSDVDARVRIRLAELTDSARLTQALLGAVAHGPISVTLPMGSGEGIGVAESFRGDAWHFVRLEGGLITANFMRDPSWAQWPLLEAAVEGNIVADFPLVNKSFNGSYSGVDL